MRASATEINECQLYVWQRDDHWIGMTSSDFVQVELQARSEEEAKEELLNSGGLRLSGTQWNYVDLGVHVSGFKMA